MHLWAALTRACALLIYGLRPQSIHFVHIKHTLRLPASMLGMTDHPWSASHFFKRRQSNQKVSCSNKLSDPLTAAPFLSYRREETSLWSARLVQTSLSGHLTSRCFYRESLSRQLIRCAYQHPCWIWQTIHGQPVTSSLRVSSNTGRENALPTRLSLELHPRN